MDRLEEDLRRVLADPRRSLPADLVPLEGVHRGAGRRRRNRAVAAAAVAVLVVAGGLTLASGQVGDSHTSLPAQSATPTPSAAPTAATSAAPTTTSSTGPSRAGFAVLVRVDSVTATGPGTIWVLGSPTCATGSGCLRLGKSTDGGRTFTGIPLGAAARSRPDQVRFADATHGWLFRQGGGDLWSTRDGGGSWHATPAPGKVFELEVGAGTAWALSRKTDDSDVLWRASVSSGAWTKVALPRTPHNADLAVDGSRVFVSDDGSAPALLRSTDGGRTFSVTRSPCVANLAGRVAASGRGVWLVCATGTAAAIHQDPVGNPSGQLDTSGIAPDSLPNSVLVAPRNTGSAVVAVPATGLFVVDSSGRVLHKHAVPGGISFVGFTTPSVGYAITATGSGTTSELLRTTDGGATWRRISTR